MIGGWDDSDRRDRLPPDWPHLRAARLKIDGHRCTWRLPSGKRCPRTATDVDHRIPGDDHGMRNLQSLCPHHHGLKSAREGAQGRRKRRTATKRPTERHPGDQR